MNTFTATQRITIEAARDKVWAALTTPELVKQYMFGADVVSDWKQGSSLVYKGTWEGTVYEDKGTILAIEPGQLLQTTYFSAHSGLPDKPEHYNLITYALTSEPGGATTLLVVQTNNATREAAARSEANWGTVLAAIKTLVEHA